MSVHEQYANDLALCALGALLGDERAQVERHLHECADCRREVELLRGDMALLAYSAAHSAPPARSRQRLMDSIRKEPRRAASRRAAWIWAPWLAASLMTIVAILLMRQNTQLQERSAQFREQSAYLHDRDARREAQLERVREIIATLTATDAQRVTLVASKAPPQPQGKTIYVRERGSLIFLANNFKAPAPGKAYELWLIPAKGNPIPAGVFKPDAHGSATIVNPPLPHGVQAKAFAITVEPQAGSPAPTSAIIMQGTGE